MAISPFKIEYIRSKLAEKKQFQELKKTYTKKYPEIKDLNSAPFWNERLEERIPLSEQDGMTQKRAKIIAGFLPKSVKKVLDIGIGPGWVEEIIEKRDIKLFGTDISDLTIKNLKKRFEGTFWIESIYELNDKKGKYDAALLLEVLEHIPPSKTFKVLKSINNVLEKNGYFILSVPTNEGLEKMKENPNGHVRLYTVPLIRAELDLSGFKVLKIKTIYAFERFYFWKDFIAKFLKTRWKPNNIIILAQKI